MNAEPLDLQNIARSVLGISPEAAAKGETQRLGPYAAQQCLELIHKLENEMRPSNVVRHLALTAHGGGSLAPEFRAMGFVGSHYESAPGRTPEEALAALEAMAVTPTRLRAEAAKLLAEAEKLEEAGKDG